MNLTNNSVSLFTISPPLPSSTTSTPPKSYYEQYRDVGMPPELAAIMTVRALISAVGICLNSTLVVATIKYKKLHTICSRLIALDCLCLALFQLNPIVTAFIFYSGIHFITAEACFWIQAIPIFCIHVQFGSMFLIGLERLLNIIFPIWSRQENSRRFHLFFLLIFFILSALVIFGYYLDNVGEKILVICQLADLNRPGSFALTSGLWRSLPIHILIAITYSSFLLIACLKKQNLTNSWRELHRSLMLIFVIEFCGWFPALNLAIIILWFQLSSFQVSILSASLSCWTAITASTNAIVLYKCSKNYREAINAIVGSLFCCRTRNSLQTTMVVPINSMPNMGNGTIARNIRSNDNIATIQQNSSSRISSFR